MRNIKHLFIHTTASSWNKKAADIQAYFLRPVAQGGRGWKVGGYHWLIEKFGERNRMYPDAIITNGAKGYNQDSVHICYIGGIDTKTMLPKDTRTLRQADALERLVREYIELYPDIKVLGHNQVANKACPCFDVPEWLEAKGIPEKNIDRRTLQLNL